jgi:hypothetical protein
MGYRKKVRCGLTWYTSKINLSAKAGGALGMLTNMRCTRSAHEGTLKYELTVSTCRACSLTRMCSRLPSGHGGRAGTLLGRRRERYTEEQRGNAAHRSSARMGYSEYPPGLTETDGRAYS